MKNAALSEELLAYMIGKDYRNKGYEVMPCHHLDFLPDFTPDLVVRKGNETKVIEVKSRSSLAASPKTKEWAQIIHSKPGWSFELILVGEPEKLDSPEHLRALEAPDILARIDQAEGVLDLGFTESAFLLAWTAFEAAIRLSIAELGSSTTEVTTTGHIVDQAAFLGVISREEYRSLMAAREYRNAIAHGFGLDNFDDKPVKDVLRAARHLLLPVDQTQPDNG